MFLPVLGAVRAAVAVVNEKIIVCFDVQLHLH
jgi:hypothetical protein